MKQLHSRDLLNFGFTIVEVVIAIVIVSILSAVAIGRFLGPNEFNDVIVRDQIVSMARMAQQGSLGRADVSLTITPNAGQDELTLEVAEVGGVMNTVTVDMAGVALRGDVNNSLDCTTADGASAITVAAPMTINFDELGDLIVSGVSGSTAAITSALRICINNEAPKSVCVSPAGFAYPGSCDVDP